MNGVPLCCGTSKSCCSGSPGHVGSNVSRMSPSAPAGRRAPDPNRNDVSSPLSEPSKHENPSGGQRQRYEGIHRRGRLRSIHHRGECHPSPIHLSRNRFNVGTESNRQSRTDSDGRTAFRSGSARRLESGDATSSLLVESAQAHETENVRECQSAPRWPCSLWESAWRRYRRGWMTRDRKKSAAKPAIKAAKVAGSGTAPAEISAVTAMPPGPPN